MGVRIEGPYCFGAVLRPLMLETPIHVQIHEVVHHLSHWNTKGKEPAEKRRGTPPQRRQSSFRSILGRRT